MDEETIKKQLVEDLIFMNGLFCAYCLDKENRQLFTYGMLLVRKYIEGTLNEAEDTALTEELMRSYQ